MTETIGNGTEREKDPRTQLADSLRGFCLQAVNQQRIVDGDLEPSHVKPAGSLYKTDSGYFKIHLQAPAADHVFYSPNRHGPQLAESRPPLWILIPMNEEATDPISELEDIIESADDIQVHVVVSERETLQFLVKNNYAGPLVPTYRTLEELQALEPPSETEQLLVASNWNKNLEHYDIRTIASSQTDAA